MNMKFNMKRMLLGVVMAAMAFTPLAAQNLEMSGFAGKDQQIFFPPDEQGSTKSVRLGPERANPDCVFEWKVVESPQPYGFSLDNIHSQQPMFTFSDAPGDYIIEATRVSKYGYQREYVVITVYSEITLISAKARNDCFKAGDALRTEFFEFVTQPEGYDEYVFLHPDNEEVKPISGGNPFERQEIKFQIHNDDGTVVDCATKGKINVIADDGGMINIPMNNELAAAMALARYEEFLAANPEMLQDFKVFEPFVKWGVKIMNFICQQDFEDPIGAAQGMETCGNILMDLGQAGGILVRAIFLKGWIAKGPGGMNLALYGHSGDFNMRMGIECCDLKQRPSVMAVFNGSPKFEIGATYDIGIPYLSFPGIGGIYFRGGLVFGLQGDYHNDFVSFGCAESPLLITPYLLGEAAIIAMARHPKILSASFGLYPGAYGTLTIGADEQTGSVRVKQIDISVKVNVECRAVTLGFQHRWSSSPLIDEHIKTISF